MVLAELVVGGGETDLGDEFGEEVGRRGGVEGEGAFEGQGWVGGEAEEEGGVEGQRVVGVVEFREEERKQRKEVEG